MKGNRQLTRIDTNESALIGRHRYPFVVGLRQSIRGSAGASPYHQCALGATLANEGPDIHDVQIRPIVVLFYPWHD
jgi:hypothetical protein